MKKILLLLGTLFPLLAACSSSSDAPLSANQSKKSFFRNAGNCEEIQSYLKDYFKHSQEQSSEISPPSFSTPLPPGNTELASPSTASNAPSPSQGVIQSDISYADTDRKLLYVLDGHQNLRIYKTAPLSSAGLVSQMILGFSGQEILTLNLGEKKYVVVFGNEFYTRPSHSRASLSIAPSSKTIVAIIDVTSAQNPLFIQQHSQEGFFAEARAIPESGQIIWASQDFVSQNSLPAEQDCQNVLLYENSEQENRYYPASLGSYTISVLNFSSPNFSLSSKTLLSPAWNSHLIVNPQHIFLTQSVSSFSKQESEIFMFGFSKVEKKIEFEASGTIAGDIPNQFFVDEKDAFIRIFHSKTSPLMQVALDSHSGLEDDAPLFGNFLSILEKKGEDLVPKGGYGPFEELETPYAARFTGNLGCIITFQQIDPLTCFDLSNPSSPQKMGALEIEGVSFHLESVTPKLLLGIGRNAAGGVVANLFDIQDPRHPQLRSQKTLSSPQTHAYSNAFYDYRALSKDPKGFSYALPFTEYRPSTSSEYSSVAIFNIDPLQAEIHLQSAVTENLSNSGNNYYPMQRAYFFDEAVACLSANQLKLYDRESFNLSLSSQLD